MSAIVPFARSYTGRYVSARARIAGVNALTLLQRRWRGKRMLGRQRYNKGLYQRKIVGRAISNYKRTGKSVV